ncbi:hypothetical protein BGZ83_000950 [Gryganskiella cystojenkinii]|nr:hypothetical protein BGZ83_000950 [Gryganskiella cystojenkinii]
MGIKPKSLEHVQDPETRDFINRCLDHDDRTRPSAQELLDSDFLKPCAAVPMLASTSMGLFNYPNRSLSEGIESMETPSSASVASNSNRSSFAEPYPSSTTSPTSGFAFPAPLSSVLPRISAAATKVQPITIPSTVYTTSTTVDADNKTYHIRSNLLPQTPTSADRATTDSAPESNTGDANEPASAENQMDPASELPTLHSHANSKTCSIQVVQYGEANGDHLNLKMICTCPVAGPRDVAMASGTHEIKFPFDLSVDTVDEVVAEMIREQILSADDRQEATTKIQDLIDSVLSARKEHARITRDKARALKSQLKVPPADDLYQYGTSPTESYYDHYSSVGSNASTDWNGHDSIVESDQGYGTVPPQPPQQPPVISEATFPPLNSTPHSRAGSKDSSERIPHEQHTQADQMQSQQQQQDSVTTTQQHQHQHQQVTYSEAVQHPVAGHLPISPRHPRSPAASRPQSFYNLESRSQSSTSVTTKNSLREIETTSLADRRKNEELEDVGYTSPYRHGVSSSSISYHRRSPSVDASLVIAQPTSKPSQTAGLSPEQPVVSSKLASATDPQHRASMVLARSPSASSETTSALSRESSLRKTLQSSHGVPGTSELQEPPSSSGNSTLNGSPVAGNRLLTQLKNAEHRIPHSANSLHHEPQHSHQHTHVAQSKSSGLLSANMGGTLAKKDIELWSHNVPTGGESMSTGTYANGSTYSSCPETSDDEEVLDEDLKVLRERQRQELELMRLQHVQQWEMMMRIKEQKGLQERNRRKSEVGAAPPPLPPPASSHQ